ncbi:EAL domain-containing protein [Leptothrix ochracea]|uniref:EAL domain-containing protein n=1 Tax=Leptothrix ochracea TaxID=735331 RepID=UPI0034E20367
MSTTDIRAAEKGQTPWSVVAYGPQASALLRDFEPSLGAFVAHVVELFYRRLMTKPEAAKVLHLLTPSEMVHLREGQRRHLEAILAPDLTAEEHHRIAVSVGMRHVNVGLSLGMLSDASLLYAQTIGEGLVAEDPAVLQSHLPLHLVLNQRFQHDLIGQLDAFAQWEHARLALLEDVVMLGYEASHVLDYVQQVLATVHDQGEIAGVALGGIRNGTYRHLLATGQVLYDAEGGVYPTVAAPYLQQAWFDEKPLIIPSVAQTDVLTPELQAECERLGARSMGLWPTRSAQGAPDACLFVFSRWPGHFANPTQQRYWQRLADQIGMTMEGLARHGGKRRHRLSDGLHYRHLLAQGRVKMHYQPIVDPRQQRVVKVEALARLQNGAGDDASIISPDKFLAAFGATQLLDLFEATLAKSIEDMARPELAGVHASVNLPTEVMRQTDWLLSLPERVARLGGDPQRIGFEIIESALTDDPLMLDALRALRDAGFSILLDDVGSGESSLLRLATLPITGIKIDQSFVRPLQSNFDKLDFILTLALLAEQRGLDCVAEGVETAGIYDMLGSLDRLLLQGYAIARPMRAADLGAWMATFERRPAPIFPNSLHGWYSRHVARLFVMRQALTTLSDVIDVSSLSDATCCPLHTILARLGGDEALEAEHIAWHRDYACFTTMAREAAGRDDGRDQLRLAMDASKQRLRRLVQSKV